MKKYLCFLLLILILPVSGLFGAASENKDLEWEGVSLDVLVEEVMADSQKEELENFNVAIKDKTISIVYRDIRFQPDSPKLTGETKEKLSRLVRVIKKFAENILQIEGHTAHVAGQEEEGKILSKERAQAVANFLSGTGVFSKDKLRTVGYGDTIPVSKTNMKLNRRVEMSIVDEVAEKEKQAAGIWWKALADQKSPGYAVVFLKDTWSTVDEIKSLLNSTGFNTLKVYGVSNGIVIIYDRASFSRDTNEPTGKTTKELDLLTGLFDSALNVFVRIGGNYGITEESAFTRQYNFGTYLANYTNLKPENIYIGNSGALPSVKPEAPKAPEKQVSFISILSSIDLTANNTNPLARYREFSLGSAGAGFAINLKVPGLDPRDFWAPMRLSFAAGGYFHIPEDTSSVSGLWELSCTAALGYKFLLLEGFSFMPKVEYGGMVHILTATRQGIGSVTGEYFYDQTLSFEGDFEITLAKSKKENTAALGLLLSPGYKIFFNNDYLGLSVTAKAGVRFIF